MRPGDAIDIIRFNTRMGMHICPSKCSNVVSFLHGYEYAKAKECRFTDSLSEHIAKRHNIKRGALGWPDQIDRLAGRRSLDWMEIYLLVSSEVLNAAIETIEGDTLRFPSV